MRFGDFPCSLPFVYKTIVVGTDGSDTAGIAVRHAISLAKLTGATLHIVSAYVREAVDIGRTLAKSESAVSSAAAEARREGVTFETHTRAGTDDTADILVALAEELQADLLVLGNRGMSGARRFMLGSVPNKVSHHCPCNLLIVNTTGA